MVNIAGKPFLEWLLVWIGSWKLEIPSNSIVTCIGHTQLKIIVIKGIYR